MLTSSRTRSTTLLRSYNPGSARSNRRKTNGFAIISSDAPSVKHGSRTISLVIFDTAIFKDIIHKCSPLHARDCRRSRWITENLILNCITHRG